MAHPFAEHRQDKVERSRVSKITGGASVSNHDDAGEDKKLVRSMVKPEALKMDGGKSAPRLDRYARGGKVGKKGATTVNVIIAGQGDKDKPPMLPPEAGMPPPMPPGPPMPPPAMAGPPPGGPPPGMMPRRTGGRAYAKGGAVSARPGTDVYQEGKRNGTKVQHSDGKNDGDKINHSPALLTRKTGGRTYPLTAGSDSGEGRLQKARAQKRA